MTSAYLDKPARAADAAALEIRMARLRLVRDALIACYRRQGRLPS